MIKIKLSILFLYLVNIHFSQTYREVYNYIRIMGIKHPDIVYAQTVVETGHYKSKICKENNNLFGMKYPKKRRTVATRVNRGHAVYRNWQESIFDYWLWQKYYYLGGDYYKFLKSWGYATSKNYIDLLKKIKK